MKNQILQKLIYALLLGWCAAIWADQRTVVVPSPRLYSERLPAKIRQTVFDAVCGGVEKAGFRLERGPERRLEAGDLQNLASSGKCVLASELTRNLGGFVLQFEPMCASGAEGRFPTQPFAIQLGQFQNISRCSEELATLLGSVSSEPASESRAPAIALLSAQVLDQRAPLFLGSYLNGRLEYALLKNGHRLCSATQLEQTLARNRLGGAFNLTPDRCRKLGQELNVASFVRLSVDTFQLDTVRRSNGKSAFQIALTVRVQEYGAASGESLKSEKFSYKLASDDSDAAMFSPDTLADANAFVQATMDKFVQEELLAVWGKR